MKDFELLSVTDVANLLKVSRRSVWRWAQQGSLPAPVRIGRRAVRWRRKDILRAIGE